MIKGVCILILSVAIASISQIILKKSTFKEYKSVIREYLNPYVIIGYGLMVVSTILTILAFKIGLDYKSSPIIESVGYIFVMILSRIFLSEKITKKKILGNAVILLGIIIFYI